MCLKHQESKMSVTWCVCDDPYQGAISYSTDF